MEGITKDQFNQLKEIYPQAHHLFLAWIDEQKKILKWNEIFNSNSDYQDMNGKNALAPKFHNLPFELQFGLLCKFISISKRGQAISFNFDIWDIHRLLTDMFRSIESRINSGFLDKK